MHCRYYSLALSHRYDFSKSNKVYSWVSFPLFPVVIILVPYSFVICMDNHLGREVKNNRNAMIAVNLIKTEQNANQPGIHIDCHLEPEHSRDSLLNVYLYYVTELQIKTHQGGTIPPTPFQLNRNDTTGNCGSLFNDCTTSPIAKDRCIWYSEINTSISFWNKNGPPKL